MAKNEELQRQIKNDFDLRQEISRLKISKYHTTDCEKCIHRAVCNMLGGYEELKKRFNGISFSGINADSLDEAQTAMMNGKCIYFGGV